MAIKPTPNNNLFKSLVFDGVDSRDYGIYITGDAVFNSPERDVEMIEIPGRNGAYALDKGRFSNIKVSYPAGIAGDTEADFREGISAFRNALASRKGYKRLEDDYNPDEYRMAVYKSGLEVTPKALKAGEFTITFDCKPQRFLKSGETAVTIGGAVTNPQTESGAIVSIEGTGADKVTSLVAQIEPVQAGSGDPSPTNVRAITGWTACSVIVSPTTTASDGTTYTVSFGSAGTVYGGTLDVVTGVLTVTHNIFAIYADWNWVKSSTYPGGFYASTLSAMGFKANTPVICSHAKTANTISEYVQGTCFVDGSLNIRIMSANSTVDDWKNYIRSERSAGREITVCGELATPQTYQLTAQQVELLTGNNNVWADTGDITITWDDDPNKLVNPTLYDAHPLLSFTASGAGTISINNDTIAVTNQPIGDIILANVTKLASGESITWTDTSRYLTGDAIRIDSIPAITTTVILDTYSYVNYSQYSGDDMDYLSTTATARGTMTQHSIPNPPQFVAGTARSVSYTGTVTNKVKNKSSGTIVDCTINLTVTIAYDGAHSITATTNVTTSLGTASTTVTIDTVTVNSTKSSLTGTAYIDLDIGEAYSIDGGAVVSINDSVALGASLPVLKPSVNAISQTGSVANLKVTPRWWEL